MIKYLVDTNFILRFLLRDIPSQTRFSRLYLQKAKDGEIGIYLSVILFVELDFAFRKFYKMTKESAVEKMKLIAEVPYLEIEKREIIYKALEAYEKNNIDFVDLIFYFEAQSSGRALLTFDKKLKKLSS